MWCWINAVGCYANRYLWKLHCSQLCNVKKYIIKKMTAQLYLPVLIFISFYFPMHNSTGDDSPSHVCDKNAECSRDRGGHGETGVPGVCLPTTTTILEKRQRNAAPWPWQNEVKTFLKKVGRLGTTMWPSRDCQLVQWIATLCHSYVHVCCYHVLYIALTLCYVHLFQPQRLSKFFFFYKV